MRSLFLHQSDLVIIVCTAVGTLQTGAMAISNHFEISWWVHDVSECIVFLFLLHVLLEKENVTFQFTHCVRFKYGVAEIKLPQVLCLWEYKREKSLPFVYVLCVHPVFNMLFTSLRLLFGMFLCALTIYFYLQCFIFCLSCRTIHLSTSQSCARRL